MEAEVQQLRTQRQVENLKTEIGQNLRAIEVKEQASAALEKSHANELAAMTEIQIHAASVEASNRVLEVTNKLKDEYVGKIDALQERIQILTARVHELELGKKCS